MTFCFQGKNLSNLSYEKQLRKHKRGYKTDKNRQWWGKIMKINDDLQWKYSDCDLLFYGQNLTDTR